MKWCLSSVVYKQPSSQTAGCLSIHSKHFPLQISLGLEHTVALTESSEIYTWGSNGQGQLGLGYCSSQSLAEPQLVECLACLPVRQVVAGAYHNLLVTPSGSVYAWGSNTHGQLGLGEETITSTSSAASAASTSAATPRLLKNMKRRGVTFAACGEEHSALLTKDGAIFTFGDGR